MLQIDNVERRYGARLVFTGLSWTIPARARLGLVGPNGVGKTTLLRIVGGLDPPDAGAVHRHGSVRVGYLPQEVESVAGGSVLAVTLSGAQEVIDLAGKLERLEQDMTGVRPADPGAADLAARYGELRHAYEVLGGDRIEARARAILEGLGVAASAIERPITELSGGWRMRVVLARLLLGAPELLLLDEPTNHLDLEALGWLEAFLAGYAGAFVVVSHDRFFLNRVASGIVELDAGRLRTYPGNYDDYVVAREQRRAALADASRHQAREIARVERFIERFRYKASKARQVQSRIRALAKVERIGEEPRAASIRFGFPPAPRSGDVVARLRDVTKRYGQRAVFSAASLLLRRGDRVALVGPNGAGKSTLLRILARREDIDAGSIELGHGVEVRYYSQHQLEELDPSRSVLDELETAAQGLERPRLRKLLGCFLFRGEDVDKRVQVLSGGERARLALARLLVRPVNLLLLDEPTNHLDLDSREVLEEALNEYAGTLVVVSHDRYFINRVATSVAEIAHGGLSSFAGDYDEFLSRQPATSCEPGTGEEVGAAAEAPTRRAEKRREAEARNLRYKHRRAIEERLAPVERRVAELEQRVQELRQRQADPAVYQDPTRAGEAGRERVAAERELERLYALWESMAAELESL